MQQINSLDRAFTVLTYFLSTKDLNQISNYKTCNELNNSADNLSKIILQANKNQDTLAAMNTTLTLIKNNFRNSRRIHQPTTQPYFCNETSLHLFCEDNRYSKHLLLIGRGRKALEPALYHQLSAGVTCDATCIKGDKGFFIGWTNFEKIHSSNLYGVLIVYIDSYDRENFLYIPEFKIGDKKSIASKSRSSMSDFNLEELMENKLTTTISLKHWRMYLKINN